MYSLSLFSPRGLIPARILRLATRVPLLLCFILSSGPALAMDGSLSFTTDSLAPAPNVIAETFETSYYLGFESRNSVRMLPLWVLDAHMADRDSRISVSGSNTRRLARTGNNETGDAGVTARSKATGVSSPESEKDSTSGSLSKGHAVSLSEGDAAAQSFTASVRGAVKTGVSLESSLWNPGRSFGVALVLSHLQSLLSGKLFVFRTEITGSSARMKIGFQEPSTRDNVWYKSILENTGNRFTLASNGVSARENNGFSCVSLSFRITF